MNEQTDQTALLSRGEEFLQIHMKREQTAFFVFIGVFMMLLIGIAILFLYNGVMVRERLETLRRESLRGQFEAIGSIAQAKAESQGAREGLQASVTALRHQTDSARADVGESLRATRDAPQTLVADAKRYAKAHILGWELNDSTAHLVTAARGAANLDKGEAALLDLALADWRSDSAAAKDAMERLSGVPEQKAYVLAAGAGKLFAEARASAGGGYGWLVGQNNGCAAVVDTVDAALAELAKPGVQPSGFDDKGLMLNLYYFKGQCLRKNGRAEAGYRTFRAALDLAESQSATEVNSFKFQAYHGAGSTLLILADDPDVKNLPDEPLDEAERLLWKAAELRESWGQTAVGVAGSTENISFIHLRQMGADRWDKILRHTAEIDAVTSMTWNLTARLIAAKEKARRLDPSDVETCHALREVVFDTGAKLSRRSQSSFDRQELQRLVTDAYSRYIDEAERWTDYASLKRMDGDTRLTAAPAKDGEEQETAQSIRADQMIADALATPCGVESSAS